jgi:hypothetical protein
MNAKRVIFHSVITYLCAMVAFGWIFSAFESYQWMGIAGLASLIATLWRARAQWQGVDRAERSELLQDLRFPPFLILLILITLAGSLYLTSVLDSLSYRIPRMLMWLQEGRVHFIDNPDARMNFMTPVWEFASTPLYQLAGFRLLWLGSALSWVLLYLSFIAIALDIGSNRQTARWLAIIPASAVGLALQAASTMNDIWAVAFITISLAFILSFEKSHIFQDIVSSGLALAIAAGVKPHFAVLALPWLLWFFFSKGRPLRVVKWRWAAPAVIVAIFCSPLPTFITNHLHYGNIKGPAGDDGFALGAWWINALLGSIMMFWQMLQLPLNPMARRLEAWNQSWIENSGLHDFAPRFKLAARELSVVDGASLGFLVTIILLCGLILIICNRKKQAPWVWWAALAGLLGYLIAVSQVVPGTLGRSFLGFTILWMPLGLAGFRLLSDKVIKISALLAAAGAAASIILSPSHPLWPAQMIANAKPAAAPIIAKYLEFHQRSWAGYTLVQQLPHDVAEIGVLAIDNQSLIQLWGGKRHPLKVRFYPKDITLEKIHDEGPEFHFLIGKTYPEPGSLYKEISSQIIKDPRFVQIASARFTSKSKRGAEPWVLYKRISPHTP